MSDQGLKYSVERVIRDLERQRSTHYQLEQDVRDSREAMCSAVHRLGNSFRAIEELEERLQIAQDREELEALRKENARLKGEVKNDEFN